MTENPPVDHPAPYPVRVDARLDAPLSRGLWLVKWVLLLPHYVVLAFLWLAFVVLSVVAFFAILVTGRYPRSLFDFNVGVLRWSWRVHYYGYGALGTDRYPPFTLADVPAYPAHLDVPYPERLSRGLVLVKWWLLAIPHYLVLAVFVGGGAWFVAAGSNSNAWDGWAWGGLVGLLVFIAAVVLLVAGRYPRPIYDFVLAMDRWALRVAAYVGLMTDAYPPFRLDLGGTDPGTRPDGPPPSSPTGTTAAEPPVDAPAGPEPVGRPRANWSTGRVVSVVIGAVLLLASTGFLIGGGTLLWADRTQRDGAFLMSPAAAVTAASYAVTSDSFRLEGAGLDWVVGEVLGTARVQATPVADGGDVFVGVGRTSAVATYLGGVAHHRLDGLGSRWGGGTMGPGMMARIGGGAPAVPPGEAGVWTASASGPGTQTLTWRPSAGDWTVVVMRADGGAGVSAELRAGATLPGLTGIAVGLFAGGGALLVVGALLVGLAVPRAHTLPPLGGNRLLARPRPAPSHKRSSLPADRR